MLKINNKNVLSVKDMGAFTGQRYYIELDPINDDISMLIEISVITPDNTSKNSLPNLWYASKLTDKVLDTYLSLQTYLTNKDNNCVGKYNVQVINGVFDERLNKVIRAINFNNLLEATDENINILVDKVADLYYGSRKEN